MAEQSNQNLQYAEQFLREGRKQEARTLLVEYVQSHQSSARGWWLLSFAVTELKQQIECVERVRRIDPNYAPASARLEKLKGNISVLPSVSPFVSSAPLQPAIISAQPATQNPAPPASPKKAKKTNNMVLQYAALALVACVALGVIGVAAVAVLRGISSVPMQSAPPAQPISVTQHSLPATWTPTITATVVATRTLVPTNTPLVESTLAVPTVQVFPTSSVPKSQIAPVKGSYAPDFKLTDVSNNQQVKLSNYEGKAVIVIFWATWCQVCKAEMPSVQLVYHAYENQGLVVLAVDVGENADLARNYQKANSLTFPVLNDASSDVASKYRITGFPTLFFVDQSGVISSVTIGGLDYMGLNRKVRSMLNLAP